jgi:biotin carboxylase/predicted N-acyltransferase
MVVSSFVMVGFGAGILPLLDAILPPRSLTVVEDPHVAKVRHVRERMSAFRCAAGLIESPVQEEDRAAELAAGWPLPDSVAAVIPGLEYGVVGAAALAEHLALPGAGLPAARVLRDKVALRTAAGSAGLAQPRWREVWTADDVRAFGQGPCVLKPANWQASVGVQLLAADDDRDDAWKRTVEAAEPLTRAPGGPTRRYLVEARLHGPEISVEVLVSDGQIVFLNVTEKTVLAGRHPVELGHVVPAPRPAGINAAMRSLIAATGFGTGTLHAEWILVDGDPYMMKCVARLPGDEIVPMIDLAYGDSFVANLVAVLSGRAPARPPRPAGAAAVRFLTAGPGLVTSVRGVDAARGVEGVSDVRVTAAPGDRLGAPQSSWDRVGRVIAACPTPELASRAADEAASAIRIRAREVGVRVVTDPRTAPRWWPAEADDPRDGLPWAAGVSDPVSFLGLADGPALWLRASGGNSGRMDPVRVLSGAVADLDADPLQVQAAVDAYPRILVSAATGYGSPVALAGKAAAEDMEALVAALIGHAREGDVTPVVLQCPAGNPLLEALAAQGFTVGVTDLYPTLQLPGESMADYLSDLPRGRRGNVRHEIKARERGSAHIYVGEEARPHLATAARLSASAYRQRNQPADDARAIPIYSRLLDRCGSDFVLTMVGDENGPVASACLIAGGTDLLLYSAGLEQPRSRAVAGYFNAAYYLPIEFAYQRGLRRILLGPTGWHTKRLRGARFTPLCSAVPAGAAALANLLAQTDRRLRPALRQLNG